MNTKITILLAFSAILTTSCLPDKGATAQQGSIEKATKSESKPMTAKEYDQQNAARKAQSASAPQVTIKSDQTGSLRTGQTYNQKPVYNNPKAQTNNPIDYSKSGVSQAEIDAKRRAKAEAKNNPPPPKPKKAPKPKVEVGPKLPSACSLINEATIAKIIGVEADYIAQKDGSGKSATQRSCFFRWEHEGIPNSGVLIQVQKNPLPDEFPEWAAYYVNAKKNQGDKAPDGTSTYRYKDFPGYGVAGAYSSELGRYYWRTKNDIVYMVALNMPEATDVQLGWAKAIAAEVNRNSKI